ncbi:hypothetical protein AC1031_012226 [Aphanomyces cochlioides]|nr:hypothetical protein AC1031_012226 [Aphanomyces cochlioides]
MLLRSRSACGWTQAVRSLSHSARCMASLQPNETASAIDEAVAEATAALRRRLEAVEKENKRLKLALREATATQKQLTEDVPQVPAVKKKLEAAQLVAAKEAKKEHNANDPRLYGGWSQREFYFRLLGCTNQLKVSPKLRQMLTSMPLMDMKWKVDEAPAILIALVLLDRVKDAIYFASRYRDAAIQRHFIVLSKRLACPGLALAILAQVSEYHGSGAVDEFFYGCAIAACSHGPKASIHVTHVLFQDMQDHGVPINAKTFGSIMCACARLDEWKRMTQIWQLVDSLPEKEAIYTEILLELGKADLHEATFRAYKHALAEKIVLPERIHRIAISSSSKISNRDDAMQQLDAFQDQMASSIESPALFNALIAAYANLHPETSFDVFQTMQDRGIVPDIYTYNSVLLACVRQRDYARGLEVFQSIADYDIVTNCTMLQLCRQANEIAMAKSVYYNCLNHLGPSTVLYEEFVETLVENNRMADAIKVYTKNKDFSSFQRTSKLLNLLLRATKDDVETAQAIFDDFSTRPLPISAVSWNHLMAAYIAADRLNDADRILHEMQRRGQASVFSYQQLMSAFYDKGDFGRCVDVYKQFVGVRFQRLNNAMRAKQLQSFPQTGLRITASRAMYEMKEFAEVVQMAPSFNAPKLHMLTEGCKRELIKQSILAAEQLNDWQTCVQLYTDMVRANCNDIAAYESTVRAVAKAGEFDAALDVDGGSWYRNERHSKGWFNPPKDDDN